MSRPVAEMLNLGAKSARVLGSIGIRTEGELRKIGIVNAYRHLKHADPKGTSLLMLYALQGALMDIHWNQLPEEIKDDLKRQLLA